MNETNQNEINYYIISKRVVTQHTIISRVREFAGSIYGLAHFFIGYLFLVKGLTVQHDLSCLIPTVKINQTQLKADDWD